MLALFVRIRDELGVRVVLVTHNEDVVKALADDVVRLDAGQTCSAVIGHPATRDRSG